MILTSGYPRKIEDGAGIFIRHMAESLSRRGIEVHVLVPAYKRGGPSVENKIYVHRFQYFLLRLQKLAYGSGILPNLKRRPWLWIEVPFFMLIMTYSLLRLLRQERPDLIHAHWVLPQGLIAVFAKLLYKVPVITTAHGSDAFALTGRLLVKLKRLVLRSSTAWTSNSRATSDAFGKNAALPKPHIIPMGVDVRRFQSGQRKNLRGGLPEDAFVILFVGRIIEQKGLEDLLLALTLLPSELACRTSLWVVGDGHYRTALERYAHHLAISEKVRFWGQISNDLLPDFYAAADLLVAPSGDAEGQGVVLTEAFTARLCVLATRAGGISEVVEDGYSGVLVQPHNPQQLAAAMQNLLNNKKLREELGANAFAKATKNYDWEKIAQEFAGLYRAVLSA